MRTTRMLALGAMVLLGCDDPAAPGRSRTVAFDFNTGTHEWAAGFADYPAGEEEAWGLESGHAALPAPLDGTRRGFHIAGVNHSDDLFMYLTVRVAGLTARAAYRVELEVEFATNAARGCVGVGGAAGESVYVKAGAAPIEPDTSVDGGGHARLNVDKGQQSQGGAHAHTIGDVATSNADCNNPVYELKTLRNEVPLDVAASDDGSLWLIVGTDSGFEALTSLYYTRIEATLTRVD